ncbi:hypothetical protein N0V82_008313 [Gnomoniopsis sp. IMI 355080]|nr:hypothetical protein N0V82_008313 [Gnomoniopsis sp. IMI 355080]
MEAYRYTPLTNNQSIRILTLHSGGHGDVLQGSMELMSIDEEAGGYEAISYVWGNAKKKRCIVCNGAELSITETLFNALTRLRCLHGPRRLWADQICINQHSLEEKAIQIPIMDVIYRRADHVLVWLGDDESGVAKEACDLINNLAAIFASERKRDGSSHNSCAESCHLPKSQEAWSPLRTLAELPWFTRAWVVQEVGTKAPATLFWGDSQIEWELLHSVCKALTDHHHLRKKLRIQTPKIQYMYRRFIESDRTSRHANRFSFFYELHRARHLMASDPRDKVFAMLGHYSIRDCSNSELRELKADYTKTVEEVYIDIAVRGLLGHEQALLTLATVQHDRLPHGTDRIELSMSEYCKISPNNLPSWVPDWRLYQSHILSEPTSPHRAGGIGSPKINVDIALQSLSIQGVFIDTIIVCSRCFRPSEFHINGSQWSQAVGDNWRDVCGYSDFNLADRYLAGPFAQASRGENPAPGGLREARIEESAVFAYLQTLSNECLGIVWQEGQPYESIPKKQWLAHGAAYLASAAATMSLGVSEELVEIAETGDAAQWARAANGASGNRLFARTKDGYYVLGPKAMLPGDILCIFQGAKVPFCLRRWGTKYLLVGECYVHGVMDGILFETATIKGVADFEIK